jgi:hypothetical protein
MYQELAQYLVIGFGLVFISSVAAVVLGKGCPRVHLYTEEEVNQINLQTQIHMLSVLMPIPTANEAIAIRKRKQQALAIIKEQENNRSANNANSLPRNQEPFPTCNDSELPYVQPCS